MQSVEIEMNEDKKLIWIFNADKGMINTIRDFFKKVINPEDYQCNLCGLTFGNFSMRKEWKSFIEGIPIPSEFLHRDEFLEQYDLKDAKFPSAYLKEGNELNVLIPEEELSKVPSLEDLKNLAKEKLKAFS